MSNCPAYPLSGTTRRFSTRRGDSGLGNAPRSSWTRRVQNSSNVTPRVRVPRGWTVKKKRICVVAVVCMFHQFQWLEIAASPFFVFPQCLMEYFDLCNVTEIVNNLLKKSVNRAKEKVEIIGNGTGDLTHNPRSLRAHVITVHKS